MKKKNCPPKNHLLPVKFQSIWTIQERTQFFKSHDGFPSVQSIICSPHFAPKHFNPFFNTTQPFCPSCSYPTLPPPCHTLLPPPNSHSAPSLPSDPPPTLLLLHFHVALWATALPHPWPVASVLQATLPPLTLPHQQQKATLSPSVREADTVRELENHCGRGREVEIEREREVEAQGEVVPGRRSGPDWPRAHRTSWSRADTVHVHCTLGVAE